MTTFDQLFDPYRQIVESTETLFTIIIHGLSIKDTIANIDHRLQLAKDLRTSKKKSIIFSQLTALKTHFDLIDAEPNQKINSIFLINDQIHEIPLQSEWLQILTEYQIDPFIFKYDQKFLIDYLKDLLTNLIFHQVIYIKNYEYIHSVINTYKKKIIFQKESKTFDIHDYLLKNINQPCVIHGVSSVLKNLSLPNHYIFTQRLTDDEILNVFKDKQITQLHQDLEFHFQMLTNPKLVHRLVFGKDIEKHIQQQSLKILFCSPTMYTKVMTRIPKSVLGTKFNIIEIDTLQKGDVGNRLQSDFAGLMGVTYF